MRIFPYRPPVQPDDERSNSPGLFILVGVVSLGMLALALALLVVPPALAAHLLIRGGRTGSIGLRLAGIALSGAWFALLVVAGRRMMGAQVRPSEREDGAERAERVDETGGGEAGGGPRA